MSKVARPLACDWCGKYMDSQDVAARAPVVPVLLLKIERLRAALKLAYPLIPRDQTTDKAIRELQIIEEALNSK